MKRLSALLILGLTLWVGCKPSTTQDGISQTELAQMICRCSESIVAHNKVLEQLSKHDNSAELVEKIKQGEAVMERATECITSSIRNDLSAVLTPDLWQKIDANCRLDERMIADIVLRIDQFNQAQEW